MQADEKKPKILFFGELPPSVVHGVSISNKINTDILRELSNLTLVEEEWNLSVHNRFSLNKVISIIKSATQIWRLTGNKRYDLYYSVLSVSFFGAVKQILFLLVIKIRKQKPQLLFHVHRSDLKVIADQSFFFRFYLSWLNQMQANYILLSKTQKRECEKYLENAYVLYNCIDELEVSPLETEIQTDIVRFLFLSNYMKEKGVFDLIKAFRVLGNQYPINLDCYGGDTDEVTKKHLLELVQGSHNITIHGPVYGKEKNRIMNNSDVLVLPSYNEGFPLVVIEALRLQKPVIVTSVGYIPEILGHDYPLYCTPGDLDSIKDSIVKAIDIHKSKSLKIAIDTIYQKISYSQHKKKLIEIFKKINRNSYETQV